MTHLEKVFAESQDLLQSRGASYDGSLSMYAQIMPILFPNGVYSEFSRQKRHYFISKIVEKLCRYCNKFNEGGHPDSSIDAGNYFILLSAYDRQIQETPDIPF